MNLHSLPLLLLLLAALPGCGQEGTSAAAAPGVPIEREIRDLMTALTPPPPTAIPVEKSDYYLNRKRTLERLRGASQAHGEEALRLLREERPSLPELRAGLLDVAAHTAPAATEALLVELTTTFGEDLLVRKRACELLGSCCPAKAIEVLEPILDQRYDGRTYPPEERMLEAWVTANDKLGLDPVPLLARIAVDLQRTQDVRHLATRALGRHDSPMSRQALQTLLIESSGNGYIRRLALQSLRTLLPAAEFCALARQTQEREADTEFVIFLQSALDERCR